MTATPIVETIDRFQQLAQAPDELPSKGQADYTKLVAAVSNASTPPVVRARCISIIADYGGYFESKLRDSLVALTQVIGTQGETDDETLGQSLQLKAIQALVGVCRKSAELMLKKTEFVVRAVVDILLQISTNDDNSFNDAVRKAAGNAFVSLQTVNFQGVLTKLLHWLSDDKDDDEASRASLERAFALDKISDMALNPTYATLWTDEVQTHVLKFLGLIIQTISAGEFSRLMGAFASLEKVKSNQCIPLMDVVLQSFKTLNDHALSCFVRLQPYIPRSAVHTGFVERIMAELPSACCDSRGVHLSKVSVLAARTATEDLAGKLIPLLLELIIKILPSDGSLPGSLTQLEALALAVATAGHKSSVAILAAISNNVEFTAKLKNLLEKSSDTINEAIFALKKDTEQRGQRDPEVLSCLVNLRQLIEPLASRRLPSVGIVGSWEKQRLLPHMKRQKQD